MTKDDVIVRLSRELYYLKNKLEEIYELIDAADLSPLEFKDKQKINACIDLINESPLFDQGEEHGN